MATLTRTTDRKARVSLPQSFADSTVIIEQISDTEVRIRKAQVIPEDEIRFAIRDARCDHRIPDPEHLIENGSIGGYAVVESSRWTFKEDGKIATDYRNLARTLGGCPDNQVGGRFKAISILTTATQEGFVKRVCNPLFSTSGTSAAIAKLLPAGIDAKRALDPDLAEQIVEYQVRLLLGRDVSDDERLEARQSAEACAPKPCTAEAFARPSCYALLSSSELVFY